LLPPSKRRWRVQPVPRPPRRLHLRLPLHRRQGGVAAVAALSGDRVLSLSIVDISWARHSIMLEARCGGGGGRLLRTPTGSDMNGARHSSKQCTRHISGGGARDN